MELFKNIQSYTRRYKKGGKRDKEEMGLIEQITT